MNEAIIYLAKVALLNAVMLGFYYLVIQPSRKIELMRRSLLAAIVLPFFLALLPVPFGQSAGDTMPVYTIQLPEMSATSISATYKPAPDYLALALKYGYFGVATIFLIGLGVSMLAIFRKKKKSRPFDTPYGRVFVNNTNESPFSFFNWVFMSLFSFNHPMRDALLMHEFTHVRFGHSYDRLLTGLFKSICWFSPFAFITSKLLSEVHEYQADACSFGTENKAEYRQLIFTFATMSIGHPQMTNPFSYHLKKRLIMLNHTKPNRLKIIPAVSGLAVILVVILFTAMIQPAGNLSDNVANMPEHSTGNQSIGAVDFHQKPGDTVFNVVDKMPEFPGGDEERMAYLMKNISYPEEARIQKTQGTVYVSFVVEKDGSISNAKILRGIGNGCDEEVLRIINNMPSWKPGMKDDKPVRTQFNMPIKFTLGSSDETDETGSASGTKADTQLPQPGEDQVYTVVEKLPEFPGGQEALWNYMGNAISYSEEAKKAKVEGTVYVNFIIEKDGTVSNAKVLRGIGYGLDEIALNAVNNMPAWIPGMKNEKPVRLQFNLPVKFSLSEGKSGNLDNLPESVIYQGRKVYYKVDVAPLFPGGNEALLGYLREKTGNPGLRFASPETDKKVNEIFLSLIVEPDGSITAGAIALEHGKSQDKYKAALNEMPVWKPGSKDGKVVPVKINLFLNEK
ncbi:MAG: M56 family metallopeptidase [Lentimicrobiaceae bacterium]|nr:M56 family metallopeptidase [Lentimicrobiaceae bacterium]